MTNSEKFVQRAWVLAVVFLLGQTLASAAADIYIETVIDPSGQLRISTKRRREIVPKKEPDQTGFGNVQISADGHAVGWLALFQKSSTVGPEATKLVIQIGNSQHSLSGNGLPILGWCFWEGAKQVAFKQEMVHGGLAVHYELRDVETGQLADKYDPDANPDSTTKPPKWVVVLDSRL
jgi:hypothetical protein